MASTVVVPNIDSIKTYPPALADALVTLSQQAQADINLIQQGGVAGTSPEHLVRVATLAALPANAYAGTGLTGTLTANANGVLTVDGVAVALGDRILVKNEVTGSNNGIYSVTTLGTASVKYVLTRTSDCAAAADLQPGMTVQSGPEGTSNASATFMLTTTAPVVLDTTALTFSKEVNVAAYGSPDQGWAKQAADGAAATATAESVIGALNNAGVLGKIVFIPVAALTGDPTNNATILIQKRTGAGAPSTVASVTTTASMVAFVPVAIPISAGAILAGDVLTVTISKGGTGVIVPAGVLQAYLA